MQELEIKSDITIEEIDQLAPSFYNKITVPSLDGITININDFIARITSKLRIKGELHIHGKDLSQIAVAVSNGSLSNEQASGLLYDGSRQILSLSRMLTYVQAYGLNVLTKKYSPNYSYYIVGQRKG